MFKSMKIKTNIDKLKIKYILHLQKINIKRLYISDYFHKILLTKETYKT